MRARLLLSCAAVGGLAAFAACGDARPVYPLDPEDAGADGASAESGEDAAAPPPPKAEPGRHDVTVSATRRIVPSAGLPPEANVLGSNNNLDVVRFDGKVFFVWRTAPTR